MVSLSKYYFWTFCDEFAIWDCKDESQYWHIYLFFLLCLYASLLFREHEVLDFKIEDLVIKTRDIQLLHITKEVQGSLKESNEQRQQQEMQSLEKQLKHGKDVGKQYFIV